MVISRYRGRPCGAGRDGQRQARHLKHGRGADVDAIAAGAPCVPHRFYTNYATALLNGSMSDGEPLIFFDRTSGGDIGWPSSQTWWDQAESLGKKALKEAMIEAVKALLLPP
jgi:hypothetical protein